VRIPRQDGKKWHQPEDEEHKVDESRPVPPARKIKDESGDERDHQHDDRDGECGLCLRRDRIEIERHLDQTQRQTCPKAVDGSGYCCRFILLIVSIRHPVSKKRALDRDILRSRTSPS
jgi:hypothetical protein